MVFFRLFPNMDTQRSAAKAQPSAQDIIIFVLLQPAYWSVKRIELHMAPHIYENII